MAAMQKVFSDESAEDNGQLFDKNPLDEKLDEELTPKLYTWALFELSDLEFIKRYQDDEIKIMSLIEKKLPKLKIFMKARSRRVFLSLAWEIFKFTRDNDFSAKGVSASLGLILMTHRFFLSRYQRTPQETNNFFYESLLFHAVKDPPEYDFIFTIQECQLLLELFFKVYMEQLPLIRLTCLPNYKIILNLE